MTRAAGAGQAGPRLSAASTLDMAPVLTSRPTHEVVNQAPPLAGHDVAGDDALLTAVTAYGADWVVPELHELGLLAGSAETAELGRLAKVHSPVLRTPDRYGHTDRRFA